MFRVLNKLIIINIIITIINTLLTVRYRQLLLIVFSHAKSTVFTFVCLPLTICQRLGPLGRDTSIFDHSTVHTLLGVEAMSSIGAASALWAVGV